ncbi:MBL fold metallo-hydrolase [Desulfovibrio sp. OttesenSCG-928-C06]|nr:MBL fold metallo-hydrolase [Desulfovibrio sp. OttesenSCG-928-C06]
MNSHNKSKPATAFTSASNKLFAAEMAVMDPADFENAKRGLIAPLPDDGRITDATGTLFDIAQYAFLEESASDESVNPSLRRHGQLLRFNGLFKVCDSIYQVRGIGSSITFIEGKTGVIVVDSGMALAIARTAKELYEAHRPGRKVVAMIITHPHGDHLGGMAALVNQEDVLAGKVKIYAPEGYLTELYSENLFAGRVMLRRAGYMFGMKLEPGARGQAGIGIGLANVKGRRAALNPTDYISHTGQVLHIDGLDFHFQLAREAEAPVELNWFIPQLKALTLSENCEQTMHNTYTLRGAKTRNPGQWSKTIQQALDLWGNEAEVLYSSHSWPVWGNQAVRRHLELARDAYRFLNDQTLHYANQGLPPDEIGELIRFPEALHRHWGTRGHYGTLSHNARGTYNYYLGWFDGNPARLNPLTRKDSSPRYVDCMGGTQAVLDKARTAYDNGEYRWAAELLDHLVRAFPDDEAGRALLADCYEQLGYQAEAAPWRNIYLTGAMELRNGIKRAPLPPEGTETGLTPGLLCDYLSIRLDSMAAAVLDFTCNLTTTRPDGQVDKTAMYVSNGVISHSENCHAPQAELSIHGPMAVFNKLVFGAVDVDEACAQGLQITGNATLLKDLLSYRGTFEPWFEIVPGSGASGESPK